MFVSQDYFVPIFEFFEKEHLNLESVLSVDLKPFPCPFFW